MSLVSEGGGLSALALQELASVSGIIGTPTQAVENELEHVVSALVRLGLLDMRQKADQQDDVADIDVGPDGAVRLSRSEQRLERVAYRPEAVARQVPLHAGRHCGEHAALHAPVVGNPP